MDFSKLRNYFFLALLALVTVAFLYMIRPFAYPLFWAAVIASIFYPLFDRLNKHLKIPNLSAAITMFVIFFSILIPVVFIGTLLVTQSIDLYGALENNRSQIYTNIKTVTDFVKNNPLTDKLNIDEQFWMDKFAEVTRVVLNYILQTIKNWTQNSLSFIVGIVIMFYSLFFFLRDGRRLLKSLMHLCPLGDDHETMLYEKFTSTASATLKGTIIVGFIQGLLGALLFWLVGVQGAIVWGLLMAAASFLPPFGTGIIWFPAGVIMLITGNLVAGIIILAVGFLIIGTIDNFLRPILVGKDTRMHPILILISTLGGIVIFGISGLVIGPVITALCVAFWEMYEHFFQKELGRNG